MTLNKSIALYHSLILILGFGIACQSQAQVRETDVPLIEPFTVTVISRDYSMAYSYAIVLTNSKLTIISKGTIVGEKDSVLFSASLKQRDTMRGLSEIDIGSWKESYSNDCIDDGSQITVKIIKGTKQKSVHLSNFYHEDVGKIIVLINSLVADKYRIWYDKEKLITDYNKCNSNSNRP